MKSQFFSSTSGAAGPSSSLVALDYRHFEARFLCDSRRARGVRYRLGDVLAYWVEADAMTTDGAIQVGFLSLGIGAEGAPVALTVFVPMGRYASCYPLAGEGSGSGPRVDCGPLGYNSDVMHAVLDSVEIIDVRRVRARR